MHYSRPTSWHTPCTCHIHILSYHFQFTWYRPAAWTSGGHSFWAKLETCTKLAHCKLGIMSVWVCSLACILPYACSSLKEARLQWWHTQVEILSKNMSSSEPASETGSWLFCPDVLTRLYWPFSGQWPSSLPCGRPWAQPGLALAFFNALRKDSATWLKCWYKSQLPIP